MGKSPHELSNFEPIGLRRIKWVDKPKQALRNLNGKGYDTASSIEASKITGNFSDVTYLQI